MRTITSYMKLNKILVDKLPEMLKPIYVESHDRAAAEFADLVAERDTLRSQVVSVAALIAKWNEQKRPDYATRWESMRHGYAKELAEALKAEPQS